MRQIILYFILGALAFSSYANQTPIYEPLQPRLDDANQHIAPALASGSHLKVFLPSVAYLYISHAINGALTRPANND